MDIKKLLSKMSTKEKLSQMTQLNSNCIMPSSTGGVSGPAAQLALDEAELACIGSTLNFSNAKEVKSIQDVHMAQDRLGIPLIFMHDVIHGYKTIYPIPLGMGATFDTELMKECAAMAAKESAAGGIQVTFSPMVDLVRDARWGRCMESTGEDVYLNSLMGVAQVEGYKEHGIVSCVKHFAAYGAAEAGRDYNTVDMSEYSLREFYLPAYKATVDAGADMVMTSFNTTAGVPSSGNKWLLRDVLREEWGFNGTIISDYNAFREMKKHGFCADDYECAERAFSAGTDIEMMSNCYIKYGEQLLKEGKLTMEQLDESVLRILELKDRMGLFDNKYGTADEEEEARLCLSPEHREIARRAAEKSAVLLKNDNVLPFDASVKKVAAIGPFSDVGMIGFWSCHGREYEAVSAAGGLRAMLGDENVLVAKGCEGTLREAPNYDMIAEAVEAAKAADAAVLCMGEARAMSGEGNSRADISLSDAQKELIRQVVKVNSKAVVVLYCGRPLALSDIIDSCPSALVMWQPGTEGGSALANLLYGKVDFEGRLPMSFPYHVGQCPVYYNRLNTGRPKANDLKPSTYVSQYLDYPNSPLYSFGYGLSYAAYEIGEPELSADTMKRGETIKVSVEVKNTGSRAGTTLVQLYVRDLVASRARPIKELCGFKHVALSAGESKIVEFEITEEALKFNTLDNGFAAENGDFAVFAGLSSDVQTNKIFKLI